MHTHGVYVHVFIHFFGYFYTLPNFLSQFFYLGIQFKCNPIP